MFAIIESGGKQYRVEEGLKLKVDRIQAEPGSELTIDRVLMVGGDAPAVGAPYVDSATVTCEVLEHGRDKKILVFHKRRRKDSRKTQGHRQEYTAIKVKAIQA
ncbi:MAG: 50S ribosomal protein L21 [Desulfovibrio sp.]|nr:MAG: 50S ribosomal protein L21 [Desulfovibrio sp.]